jgi:hypothetical protein
MRIEKSVLSVVLTVLTVLILGLMSFLSLQTSSVYAASFRQQATPRGPNRYTTMTVDITLFEWWIADWKTNDIHCSFWVDHDGLPYDTDIYSACGKTFYTEWKAHSAPCGNEDITTCDGYYLINASSKPGKKDVSVTLPPPVVWISVENCEPDPDGWCTKEPLLVLTGEEPLPNESITKIHGYIGEDAFTCPKNPCKFKLKETEPEGVHIQFWADSTYGDTSQLFTGILRVLSDTSNGDRLVPRLYVDVLSTQWTGLPAASCAQAWEAFPPREGLPNWLTTPQVSDDLKSNIPYGYLAANLISQGVVDVSACPNGGLLPDGSANACGMEAAKPAVEKWQNQFDKLIFTVAQENEVPAQLLKNLFSRESQFWPGVFRNTKDIGLGQLTEDGADTALLWNPSFYDQFCPLILNKNLCEAKGYANLKPKQQALLRGALVHSVDARCENCPLGLDISRANFSVKIFAHTLLANCEQAGKIVQNVTDQAPGLTVSYEDMWRFTMVNYNAGPGCLSDAMQLAYDTNGEVSWEGVSAQLDPTCQGAIDYVNDISKVAEAPPATQTPTPEPDETDATPTPDHDGE